MKRFGALFIAMLWASVTLAEPPWIPPPAPLNYVPAHSGANGDITALTLTGITFGTSLYPNYTASGTHYDATSQLLVNTIGAKQALVGLSSQDSAYSTWVNTYEPGSDVTGFVTGYFISPNGGKALLPATRTSDASGSPTRVVALSPLAVCDNASTAINCDAEYHEIVITSTALWNGALNENSIGNAWGNAAAVEPWTRNPTHFAENFRLDCGLAGSPYTYDCSDALHILPNGAQYISGIVFDQTTLDTSVETIPCALCLASNQAITWYNGAGQANETWKVYSDGTNLNVSSVQGSAKTIFGGTGTNFQIELLNTAVSSNPSLIGTGGAGAMFIDGNQGLNLATGGNPGTTRINISNAGTTTLNYPRADGANVYQAAGSSYTVAANIDRVVLKSVSSPYTLTAPASPVDGQVLVVECGVSVASFQLVPNTGQSVVGTPSSCSATQGHEFHYSTTYTSWYSDY